MSWLYMCHLIYTEVKYLPIKTYYINEENRNKIYGTLAYPLTHAAPLR